MKFQKSFFTLMLIFAMLSFINIVSAGIINPHHCEPLDQLNKTLDENLELTQEQKIKVLAINHQYWTARKQLIDTPKKIGQHTALLACWDKWQNNLSATLTEAQLEKFMEWQSQVDLLSRKPF